MAIALQVVAGCARYDALAEGTLCTASDAVVFSCHVAEQVISLCRSTEGDATLYARVGTIDEVEIESPVGSPFYLREEPRVGGGSTELIFHHGSSEYRIFASVYRSEPTEEFPDGVPIFEDGLDIYRAGEQAEHLVCDDGGAGLLQPLDAIPNLIRQPD